MTCPKCGATLDPEDYIKAEPDVGIYGSAWYCTACEISIDEEGDEI